VRDRVRCVSDRKHIQAIDQILAHPELAGINADFAAAETRRKIKHDLAWYATLGSRNFAAGFVPKDSSGISSRELQIFSRKYVEVWQKQYICIFLRLTMK
jgi:hypothetical protein